MKTVLCFLGVLAVGCGAKVVVDGGGGSQGAGNGGGGSSAPGSGACLVKGNALPYCISYAGLTGSELTNIQYGCPAYNGGTWVTSCPTDNALGACARTYDGVPASMTYYSDYGLSADEAEFDCTAGGGIWTPS